nr:alpha-L-rhamnosidase N-terminal domain-containing protein [uncultured Acetatifactor sp.]
MRNTHWIQGDNLCESPLFRRSFFLEQLPARDRIAVCGLGYFHLYANGKRVDDQEFAPAPTNYTSTLGCDTTYPVWEERAGYRCLYLEYDLLPCLAQGENVLGFHLGNGWFHQTRRNAEGAFLYGFPKLRYELALAWPDGKTALIESGPETLWKPSGILQNNLFYGETQDLALLQEDWCSPAAPLTGWQPARPSHAPQTQLTKQECPPDKVLRTLKPCLLAETAGRKLYDCGENISGCVPSDCPHRERLGYTGDGQLTCEAAMLTLDVKGLYEKWYQDILDSQGADTGHIPHTAPFLGGGGGPGGWGSAVYLLPMAFHRIYGDKSLLEKGYPAMIRWLEYMDSRSEDGIVVREEEGGWCLGEWSAPGPQEDMIPSEFVNTYYYIQGLKACREAAALLDREAPAWLEERIRASEEALLRRYFDPQTGDFCSGRGAANAFARILHLGDVRTKENLIAKYRAATTLDTGIFGTPILLEQLFREGEADLAYRLLTSQGPASFARMKQAGATTLWEAWDGSSSHNHPMFGSVVKLLFTEILGIRQKEGSCGFRDITLAPAQIPALQWAEGQIRTPAGTVHVRWDRTPQGTLAITSRLPPDAKDS